MSLTRVGLAVAFALANGVPGGAVAQEERSDLGISVLHGAGIGLVWLALPVETARANLGRDYVYAARPGAVIGRLGIWVAVGVASELIAREVLDPDVHARARRNGWIGAVAGFTVGNAIGRAVDRDRQLVGGYLGMGLGALVGVTVALLDDPAPNDPLPGARWAVPVTIRVAF